LRSSFQFKDPEIGDRYISDISSVHFLPRGRKRNQKKTPVSRLILRVAQSVDAARVMLSGKASSEARRAAIARL
jgi:hypothetical protein